MAEDFDLRPPDEHFIGGSAKSHPERNRKPPPGLYRFGVVGNSTVHKETRVKKGSFLGERSRLSDTIHSIDIYLDAVGNDDVPDRGIELDFHLARA